MPNTKSRTEVINAILELRQKGVTDEEIAKAALYKSNFDRAVETLLDPSKTPRNLPGRCEGLRQLLKKIRKTEDERALRIMYWNHGGSDHSQYVPSKGDRSSHDKYHVVMQSRVKKTQPHIIVVAEMASQEARKAVASDGYRMLGQSNTNQNQVAVFVRQDLVATVVREEPRWITVDVTIGTKKTVTLTGVHLPHVQSLPEEEFKDLQKASTRGTRYIVIGDYNRHHQPKKWDVFADPRICTVHESEVSTCDFMVVGEDFSESHACFTQEPRFEKHSHPTIEGKVWLN